MSVEDSDSDFQSDESDYEAKSKLDDGGKDDEEECSYAEMVRLHSNLMNFQHIYNNNAIIDKQYMDEAGPRTDDISVTSELDLINNYVQGLFSFSTSSSEEDGSSPDDDLNQSCNHDWVQLYEEVVSTSPFRSSADGQMTRADDAENEESHLEDVE